METYTKVERDALVAALRKRDGDICTYPGCDKPLDFTLDEHDRMFVTIDHKHPRAQCKADGWSMEKTWALSNLQLMHKRCNAAKGDKLYREDGTLPAPKQRKMVRREKRASRPTLTDCCYSGRLLLWGEVCSECGHGALEGTFPAEYVVRSKDCPHSGPWSCWSCYIGHTPRQSAFVIASDMAEGFRELLEESESDE